MGQPGTGARRSASELQQAGETCFCRRNTAAILLSACQPLGPVCLALLRKAAQTASPFRRTQLTLLMTCHLTISSPRAPSSSYSPLPSSSVSSASISPLVLIYPSHSTSLPLSLPSHSPSWVSAPLARRISTPSPGY